MTQAQIDNFKLDQRIEALIEAANGMTTEEAVKYIEHGREMVNIIRIAQSVCLYGSSCEECKVSPCKKRDILAKLEGK